MESFIVRIYRRPCGGAAELSGTVECVGSGRRQGFSGREELFELLTGERGPPVDGRVDARPASTRRARR